MPEINNLIIRLEDKIDALLERNGYLSSTLKNQETNIDKLKLEMETKNKTIEELSFELEQSKQQIVKPTLENNNQNLVTYKDKINELVKEIDACISLLNGK